MRYRILILSGIYPLNKNSYGGIFIRKRLEYLVKNNVDFDIFSIKNIDSFFLIFLKKFFGKNILNDDKKFLEFEKYIWNFVVNNRNFNDYIFQRIYIKKIFKKLEKRININKYNIISAHWIYPEGLIAYKIKKKYGIPYSITLHGSDIHTNPFKNEKIKKYTLKVLENADKCIFVSDALRKKAIEFGYSNKNSVVISNGYDPNIFYFENKKNKKKKLKFKAEKLIGFVGNLIDVKNILILPEIFEKVKNEYKNVEFVIVGEGNLKKNLEKSFQEKSLEVRFTGKLKQEQVAEYMKAMDVMILPSKNEGWPCVILESQACGTYTVGSKVGGIPEAIGAVGETFELDENFVDNISKSIINKLKNGYDMDKILKRVKNFTWEEIVEKEIEIFNKIIK